MFKAAPALLSCSQGKELGWMFKADPALLS